MQVLANGIINGSTIALLALSFQLVYMPTRAFHVALAAVYTVVPLLTWQLAAWGLPWTVASAAALLGGMAFSAAIDLFNHVPLQRRRAGYVAHLLSSLGIYIVTVQVVVIVWGNETKSLWEMPGVLRFAGVIITLPHAVSGLVAIATLAAFFAWLRYSDAGLTFRALADNSKEVALRGYNVSRLRLLAFCISGLLAGVAALLEAQSVGFYPYGGLDAFVVAVAAAIIGGRTSLLGPVLAGFLIGYARSEVAWTLSAQWQDGVIFVLLMVFLLLRPQGLIARRGRIEADA